MPSNEIFLRPLCEEDANVSWRWRHNPEIWKWTSFNPAVYDVTPEKELAWAKSCIADPSRRTLTICLRDNSTPIGIVSIKSIDFDKRTAGINVFLGDTAWFGKGYGYEALRLGCEYARRELNLLSLTANVADENKASVAVFKKAGFVFSDEFVQFPNAKMRRSVLLFKSE